MSPDEDETTAAEVSAQAPVQVNEYMTKNTYVLYDEEGDYDDWVELHNTTGQSVSLRGMYLSDNSEKPGKWEFPAETYIPADGYLIVYLSGKDKVTESGEIHTNFKLGGEKDNIVGLFSSDGKAVDSLPLVDLDENVSYGRSAENPGELKYFANPTPGEKNSSVSFAELSAIRAKSNCTVLINEVSAAYDVGNKTSGQYDWIELYNASNSPVSLTGYGLYKSSGEDKKFTFPDGVTLDAGGYSVVYLIGDNPVPSDIKGKLIANFKVDSSGDQLLISDPNGEIIDKFFSGKLRIGVTSGRAETTDRVFFDTPTPGAENSGKYYTSYFKKPVFSSDGGIVESGTVLNITADIGTVRYTTDGSEPKASSPEYKDGITITKSTTVKAKVFGDDKLPSDTVTATFCVGMQHTLPIVCLSADPDDLFGYTNGILANGPGYGGDFPYVGANFWKDWERKATIEYFENGVKQVEFNAGINVFGQYTRAYDKKSLAIHLRDNYGAKSVTFPFFKDNNVTTHTDFVLRAGGQDSNKLELRDAFCAMVMKGYTDLAYMDWQPVALYINGKYYGFYNLREKINESYLDSHRDIDKDNVSIIKGNSKILAGTYDEYKAMLEYAKSHDLSIAENYDYMCKHMDIDNFIDYLIVEIFFCNGDTGNIKFYKGGGETDKWQWVMYDLDMAMYSDALWTTSSSISKLFDPQGHGSGHGFRTNLQRALIANKTFKDKFLKRYAELYNTAFTEEHMNAVLDEMVELVDGEMANNEKCWPKFSYQKWKNNYVPELHKVINGRREVAKAQLQSFLGVSNQTMNELFK
ncbi:MAG: CotH kinase family protein [Clostridiales bacterium]|nr:CotH kinase family protein [Clostridiales bacterium]